ncbi:pentapeptide repeat-containing protein [Streptomyces flaveolus]|uniref:pentapeptide repeat-containing protein n=1 Tax=Streptomyces flaveolus TaxID=67297 RepID=UPI0036FB83CD
MLGVLLSSFIAAAGIWYSNNQVSQSTKIAQEGQITDRYTRAVENLGDDAVDVRLGGIYALKRIMEDSPRDHSTIVNVLATYLRTHAVAPLKKCENASADVIAAATVIASRDATRDFAIIFDLSNTRLPGLEVQALGLRGSNVWLGARLRRAILSGADWSNATLKWADLEEAKLDQADLSGADLTNADLQGVRMEKANLSGALLFRADLRKYGRGGESS